MRYINFTLPGKPDLLVSMVENADGSIQVTLNLAPGAKGDIRGLFFDVRDASLLPHLSVSGSDVTTSKFGDESVMDLGRGVNMQGGGRGPFDGGVAFGSPGNGKDVISSTTFTLSSDVGGLTLDDFALVDFGVRFTGGGTPPKNVMTTPAAADAHDDVLVATEDETITFDVLANDTDEDGTADFRIVSVSDPEHGTATISADGKSIIYTPDHDYSGPDSFSYEMTDGHGSGDSADATIGVIAVADAPDLTVTTAAGSNVNEIVITVSAAVTDTDGSEYIDRFEFSGLPAGAVIVGESDLVYDPATNGQTMSQTFTVQLAANTDFDFDLGVTAISKEVSNGSEAGSTETVGVLVEANTNSFDMNFEAVDQSIWGSGDSFVLEDNRFLGFEFDPAEIETGGFVYGSADLYLKAGFQSHLTFNGGEIDAEVPYEIVIDTTYNHTTDVLQIESFADLLSGGAFSTEGPTGNYMLDFIFNWAIKAELGLDFAVDDVELFSFDEGSNNSINILNIDAEDIGIGYEFPFGLSAELAWPSISTDSLASLTNVFSSIGASNNFFTLGLDVDQALADIFLRGVNPFSLGFDVGVAGGSVDLLDVDLSAGLNFLQEFIMTVGELEGTLVFENGATQAWDFSDIVLTEASQYDADGDGVIEFSLDLTPDATLTNDTDLGINFGYNIDLLKADGWWDIGVDSGDWSEGPLWSVGDTFPVASIDLYESTFALQFQSQTLNFSANEVVIA